MASHEYVIMFVDMQGSTDFKYREKEDVVNFVINRLVESIWQQAFNAPVFKFTGDGAMIGYHVDNPDDHAVYADTLEKAIRIIQQADQDNLRFGALADPPPHWCRLRPLPPPHADGQ